MKRKHHWDDYTVYVYLNPYDNNPICRYTTTHLYKAIIKFIKWNLDYEAETIRLNHNRY